MINKESVLGCIASNISNISIPSLFSLFQTSLYLNLLNDFYRPTEHYEVLCTFYKLYLVTWSLFRKILKLFLPSFFWPTPAGYSARKFYKEAVSLALSNSTSSWFRFFFSLSLLDLRFEFSLTIYYCDSYVILLEFLSMNKDWNIS